MLLFFVTNMLRLQSFFSDTIWELAFVEVRRNHVATVDNVVLGRRPKVDLLPIFTRRNKDATTNFFLGRGNVSVVRDR
jgi:hypothetical protein